MAALASPAAAQLRPAEGRRAVDQMLAALGGDRFLAMRNRVERGRAYSFYHDQLSGLTRASFYFTYPAPPSPLPSSYVGVRERQALGKREDVIYIYTEKDAYDITYRGARPMPDDIASRWKESLLHNVLHIVRCRLNEPSMVFDYKRTDILQNLPVEIVEIADSEGRAVQVWLDKATHLPVRQAWTRRDPRSGLPIEEVTIFAKFRDVGGGVQWPFVIRRERDGTRIFEMFADSIEINQKLGAGLFELPPGIKLLPPRP